MKTSLKFIATIAVLLTFSSSSSLAKNSEDWIVRMRGLYVKTDTSSKVSTLGGHVSTSSSQVPEVDFTRFITPNLAAELIVATTHHDMY